MIVLETTDAFAYLFGSGMKIFSDEPEKNKNKKKTARELEIDML